MAGAELVIAVTSVVLAVAALLFAIVQTVWALAQYMSSMNRCGPSVTGAFFLRQGILYSLVTFSLNPRYRMPVLNMPGLRDKLPVMEQAQDHPSDFVGGHNYMSASNSYCDVTVPRIVGYRPRRGQISRRNTLIEVTCRALGAPLVPFVSLCALMVSLPCCMSELLYSCRSGDYSAWRSRPARGDCGEGCNVLMFAPWRWLFGDARKFKSEEMRNINTSPDVLTTPGLEAASWVQFLMNYQACWWGYASLRFEWRLASTIPTDILGAMAETTNADLELLAIMGGMHLTGENQVMASSRCGEQITYSHHDLLGRVAYYRSGRENVETEILMQRPKSSLDWLYDCVEARRLSKQRGWRTSRTYSNRKVELDNSAQYDSASIDKTTIQAVIEQMARRRTQYDAQLNYSCGRAMWIFDTRGFVSDSMLIQNDRDGWSKLKVSVFRGPLGSGLNSCSCVQCCEEWVRESGLKHNSSQPVRHIPSWPALKVSHPNRPVVSNALCIGPLDSSFENEMMTEVDIMVRKYCARRCHRTQCFCGRIARFAAPYTADRLPFDESLAVAAINTAWLGRVDSAMLLQAAEDLVFEPEQGSIPPAGDLNMIRSVMSYTEIMLLKIREDIGSTNIWDSPLGPDLTDFSPVVLGA